MYIELYIVYVYAFTMYFIFSYCFLSTFEYRTTHLYSTMYKKWPTYTEPTNQYKPNII